MKYYRTAVRVYDPWQKRQKDSTVGREAEAERSLVSTSRSSSPSDYSVEVLEESERGWRRAGEVQVEFDLCMDLKAEAVF